MTGDIRVPIPAPKFLDFLFGVRPDVRIRLSLLEDKSIRLEALYRGYPVKRVIVPFAK